MSEIQRLESIPSNMRMNYGPVLKKDNPLISSWVAAVNDLPTDSPADKTPKDFNKMKMLGSIIALLSTLVSKLFDDEESTSKTKE